MLHDLQRDNAVADMLEVALQTMDVDRNLQQMMELRTGMRVVNARAQMNYYRAEHLARQTEWEKVRENLTKAIEANPDDVDVVIAMYRVPNATDEWKADTMRRIQSAVNGFRAQIATIEPIQQRAPNPEVGRQLALLYNNLAWLIGNTTGDYAEAVRLSHKSLELVPDTAGYLDTLGRCYYAKGDYANAVKYQAQAVRLDPHTQQIRRQLELFEKALAGKSSEAK
ncbi:MAG: tetratricopeptide repeat protein [Planctomycetales bacterium]|nr:tetratricopeptide repeat protein [Planctomycetales bacterium]